MRTPRRDTLSTMGTHPSAPGWTRPGWCPEILRGLAILLLLWVPPPVQASVGDRSTGYKSCLSDCVHRTCASLEGLALFYEQQSWYERALWWTCDERCRYDCMWETVEASQELGGVIPQFYGKWPFVALLGLQEPVSTVSSFANGATTAAMLVRFRRQVSPRAPMYFLWQGMALFHINAWFWSTLFHARDFHFTEIMDYFCAYSSVLYLLFVLVARLWLHRPYKYTVTWAVLLGLWYCYHVTRMWPIINYKYNMVVNVCTGALSSIGWLIWLHKVRRRQPYVWRSAAVVISTNLLLVLLELNDFPPWFWTLDAHALWHTGTSPLPLLWYRFCIDDCHFLLEEQKLDQLQKHSVHQNGHTQISIIEDDLDFSKIKIM